MPEQATGAERVRLAHMLAGAGAPVEAPLLSVAHVENPLPQARSRSTRSGRHFTDKRTAAAQARTARTLLVAHRGRPMLEGNLAVAAIFYRDSLRGVDGDNLLKLITDAATKAHVWKDDSQVTGWCCAIELDRENPRTVFAVARHQSSLLR